MRYYDPGLGRFISPDTVVPGNADGGLEGIALTPLTVAFHKPGFVATLQVENQQPFWFQMSAEQRQQAGNPMGPANPQALNRYAYTQNNPIKWTDPSGHWTFTIGFGGELYPLAAGGRGSVSISFDSSGNVAFTKTGGGVFHMVPGIGWGNSIGGTTMPTVFDLKGKSVALGGQFGEGFTVSLEGTLFRSDGVLYQGGTLTLSPGEIALLPFDMYGAFEHTEVDCLGNPVVVVKYFYDEANQTLRRMATPPHLS